MTHKSIDLSFCIDALRNSMMLRGKALQIELAVGLIAYHEIGTTDINAKKVLRGIYASAGQADCIDPGSESYKTVSRRIGYIADLYDKLRAKTVKKWIDDKTGSDAIDAIILGLEPYEFGAMDNVRQFVAEVPAKKKSDAPVEVEIESQPESQPQHRRATDAPGTVHIVTEHIDLPIPPDTPPDELISLAMQLMELAKKSSTKNE